MDKRILSPSQLRGGITRFLLLLVLFQVITSIGQVMGEFTNRHEIKDQIERRISLDMAYLDVGNQTLNTQVNVNAVRSYIERINTTLTNTGANARVSAIQHVGLLDAIDHSAYSTEVISLKTSEQIVEVELVFPTLWSSIYIHWAPFLFALLLAPISIKRKAKPTKLPPVDLAPIEVPKPRLIIDLNTKTLSNGVDGKPVILQNKPLCFYTALVRYCIANPDKALMHHQDIPADLTMMANKVFSRLIELGHTKRKRPDFNANLDKTLSEVRAALDEIFEHHTLEKERYYPPRAQGEGSRSKQHSFAIANLKEEDVEIIGK